MEANQYTSRTERLEHQLNFHKSRDRDMVPVSISDLEYLMRVMRSVGESQAEAKPLK